jgi:hypothetical protein
VTVTEELLVTFGQATVPAQGLPGYSFVRAAGESWRSRFDATQNLILINNGHRDFVFASRTKALKLRYLVRLYAKELIMRNFAGMPTEQLLDRMIELSLRTEDLFPAVGAEELGFGRVSIQLLRAGSGRL